MIAILFECVIDIVDVKKIIIHGVIRISLVWMVKKIVTGFIIGEQSRKMCCCCEGELKGTVYFGCC